MNDDRRDVFLDTLDHKHKVNNFILRIADMLIDRGLTHDNSKLESPEIEVFAEYTPKLKTSTYGSEEYKGFLREMKPALDHHYAENAHHPEHRKRYVCNGCFAVYKDPPNRCPTCGYSDFQEEADISQMTLVDLIEMICDWKAATMRHNDGDIQRSITINKERFKYSDELEAILRNTVRLLET